MITNLIKILIFLSLGLSFKAFSIDNSAGLLESQTEAGFISNCLNCKTNTENLYLSENQKTCLQLINSEECNHVPEKDRKTCLKDNTETVDTSSFLLQCLKETALSFKFIFDLLWYGLSSSTSWLLSSDKNIGKSSAKNYLLIEFYKAYLTTKGSKTERAIKAAGIVGKESFNLLWSNISNFLVSEYKGFKCYSTRAQLSLGCVFVAGLLVPIPGASAVSILKTGAKATTKIIQPSKTGVNNLTRKIQIDSLKSYTVSNFQTIQNNVLKRSKSLTERNKNQINLFFKNVNKENFVNSISKQLHKVKNKPISREDIRNAVIASLAVGTTNLAYLSPKSVVVITEGVVDALSVKYISDEIL